MNFLKWYARGIRTILRFRWIRNELVMLPLGLTGLVIVTIVVRTLTHSSWAYAICVIGYLVWLPYMYWRHEE